jgi:hypothetical protein
VTDARYFFYERRGGASVACPVRLFRSTWPMSGR